MRLRTIARPAFVANNASMWQARPIFISSTFVDMQAERDYLRTRVFPELEERLRARRHHLEWVDLRVGIATAAQRDDEAARELHVLKVCLAEVARCRPFLIVLLGDRYGWVPPPDRVRAAAGEAGLSAVEGVGGVIATAVAEFLALPTNAAVVRRLRDAGVTTEEAGAAGAAGAGAGAAGGLEQTLAGKAVVVTGAVPGYSREGAEEAIMARGGTSPGSVSKKTFALVVGDAPGAAKLKKAEEVGTPVVDAAAFETLLQTGSLP